MSNEISRNTRITWSKNGAEIISSVSETIDQVGDAIIEEVQLIGDTSVDLNFGEVAGAAHLMFKNMETPYSSLEAADKAAYASRDDYEKKNSVYVSGKSPALSTDPGVFQIIPGSGVSMTTNDTPAFYAIRDTNNVHLLVVAIEV